MLRSDTSSSSRPSPLHVSRQEGTAIGSLAQLGLSIALAVFYVSGPLCAAERTKAAGAEQLEIEHRLSLDFETPHTKWAKPYAGGPIRVLFFCAQRQGSSITREIIELMQRFDLDAQAIYYRVQFKRLLGDGNPRWYGHPDVGTKRAMRLLSEPVDAFFFNEVTPAELSEELRHQLLAAVRNGAGIVVVGGNQEGDWLAEAKTVQSPAKLPEAKYLELGKGRVVVLPSREQLAFAIGWEVQFDYQMEQQGRALFWAARREPQADLEVNTEAAKWDRDRLEPSRGGPAATTRWTHAPADARCKLVLRRPDGWTTNLLDEPCASTSGSAQIALPLVRAGQYHLDAFLTSPRGVESWATASFAVTSERHIEAVTLERSWAEVGQHVRGQVELAGGRRADDRLRVQLIDPSGRVLEREQIDETSSPRLRFQFEVTEWMPMLLRVQAVLVNDGDEIAAAETLCNVVKRHHDQYNFVVWNYPSGDLAPYGVKSMAQNGATAILQGGNPPLFLAAYELSYVPYTTRLCPNTHSVTGMLDTNGVLKGGCWNDLGTMDRNIAKVVDRYRDSLGHGVLAYSLGDENAVRASCLSSHCLQAYRQYLSSVYEDIDALNAQWDSSYRDFNEVELLGSDRLQSPAASPWFGAYFQELIEKHRTDTDQLSEEQIRLGLINDEVAALHGDNFARWYDRQAFQNVNMVELSKRYAAAFERLDPQARTGMEGTDSFSIRRPTTRSRQGGDVDLIVRELDYFIPYADPVNELLRSITPPGYMCGNWMGYRKDADSLLQKYWEQVTNGLNTVQWWRWDCLEEYHGFLAPDFSPYPATRKLLEDTAVVRNGLGTLLMHSKMHDDAVAMLYSLPSTYVAHLDVNPSFGDYKRDHRLWHEVLNECGLQFRYVTDRMLRLGEFDASRFNVLILPLALAIGEKEADAIREFVRNGGTVIADVRPGVYSGHCKRLERGALDDLFGIERLGNKKAASIDRVSVAGEVNGKPLKWQWGNWHGREVYPLVRVDRAVKVTDGKPLGKSFYHHYWNAGAPACIVREFGAGHAVLLNFSLRNAAAQPLIQELLAAAGVVPQIEISTPDGVPVRGVEITRWQNGDLELLSLYGTYDGKVMVQLSDQRYVCDLQHPAAPIHAWNFRTKLRPYRANFYALSPSPLSTPEIRIERTPLKRGTRLRATVQVPDAGGSHVLRFSARAPSGQTVPWLDPILLVGSDPVEIVRPVAFNDPSGTWTISVSDLFSTHAVTHPVTVD